MQQRTNRGFTIPNRPSTHVFMACIAQCCTQTEQQQTFLPGKGLANVVIMSFELIAWPRPKKKKQNDLAAYVSYRCYDGHENYSKH